MMGNGKSYNGVLNGTLSSFGPNGNLFSSGSNDKSFNPKKKEKKRDVALPLIWMVEF